MYQTTLIVKYNYWHLKIVKRQSKLFVLEPVTMNHDILAISSSKSADNSDCPLAFKIVILIN
jgi:hypothetical protein